MRAAHTPMHVIAARVLCKRGAEMCNVDFEDSWKQYGEDYLRDAQAMLDAIGAPDLLDACLTLLAWDEAENNAEAFDKDQGKAWRERQALCAASFDKARAAIAKATGAAS